jgi:hypothetical protein
MIARGVELDRLVSYREWLGRMSTGDIDVSEFETTPADTIEQYTNFGYSTWPRNAMVSNIAILGTIIAKD